MILIDRWIKLMEYITIHKTATVEDLMNEFKISKSTIRRDLIAMEERKLVKRNRGGAELLANELPTISTINSVLNLYKDEKIKIGEKAASLIKDNDFIFMDSGSSCYYIIDFIAAKNVTVVTNGLVHIQRLLEKKHIETYILGGYAKPNVNLIHGEDTEKKIASMNFDLAFLGTMGIDPDAGFTTATLFDGELKKAVIKSSKACYILADTSKFKYKSFYTYGDLSEATVITDSKVEFDNKDLKIIY